MKMSCRYIPVEYLREVQRGGGNHTSGINFAFSHQVHKDVSIFEIFMAIMFR